MTNYYTVEFRLYGVNLDVESVTREFGIEPATIQKIGEEDALGKRFEENVWGVSRLTRNGGITGWSSLQDGLTDLLELLEPLKSKIELMDASIARIFWCAYFHESVVADLRIDSRVLKSISDLEAELSFSAYYCH